MHSVGHKFIAKTTQKLGKSEMHTIRHGIWWENWNSCKMRNTHCRRWIVARNTEKKEKLRDSHCRTWIYGEKHSKMWKNRNAHCRTWNIVRKLKIMENEKNTQQGMEYGEKHWKLWKMRHKKSLIWSVAGSTQKRGKWEMHTVGPVICREN